MSDEIRDEKIEVEPTEEVKAEEVVSTEEVEKVNNDVAEEVKADDVVDNVENNDTVIVDNPEAEVTADEVPADDKTDAVESDKEVSTNEADEVEDEVKEDAKDTVEEVAEVDERDTRIAELEAQIAEQQANEEIVNDVRTFSVNEEKRNNDFATVATAVQNALNSELAKYGIDATKTIEELDKEDKFKAVKARELIEEAQAIVEDARVRLNEASKEELTQIVFKKASQFFEKFNLTKDEMGPIAETFLNIVDKVGVADLSDDLMYKVELAVARGRMLAPKVQKATEAVIDVAHDVKELVNDIMTPTPTMSPDEIEAIERIKTETTDKAVEEDKPTEAVTVDEVSAEPKANIEAFKEDITPSVVADEAVDVINIDNVLQKLAECPFKERVNFYKKHEDLIKEATVKSYKK